jgi:large subunit ribosomal protein L24
MKIKKGDEVVVISGKYKGVKGKVLQARPTESRVVVEGVNRHKWHIKPTQEQPGHIIDREAPIHVSNVALIDPKTKKRTRIAHEINKDGKKVRVSSKSKNKLD